MVFVFLIVKRMSMEVSDGFWKRLLDGGRGGEKRT